MTKPKRKPGPRRNVCIPLLRRGGYLQRLKRMAKELELKQCELVEEMIDEFWERRKR